MTLKQHRTKKGLSLRDVQKITGLHNSYISLLERGLRKPSISAIYKLAEAYKVCPSSILKSLDNEVGVFGLCPKWKGKKINV